MHLYSIILSAVAKISSLILLQLFPACFSRNNNSILPQNSLGSYDKKNVDVPETMIAGDLSDFIGDLSRLLLRAFCLILKLFFFQTHKLVFDLVD